MLRSVKCEVTLIYDPLNGPFRLTAHGEGNSRRRFKGDLREVTEGLMQDLGGKLKFRHDNLMHQRRRGFQR